MKRLLTAVLAAALPVSAIAADSYTLDGVHTNPSFEVSHMGFSIQRGRFTKLTGTAVLDTSAKSGTIEVVIDAASVDTLNDKTVAHVKSEDFLFVEKYPSITFKSGKLRFEGDKLVGADGDLTIRGVTKPVSLAVLNFKCGAHPYSKKPMCGANATTTIKRSEFGVMYGLPAIGDDLTINIPIEAYKS
jgi:polyisoprenoid-binding protein YceI